MAAIMLQGFQSCYESQFLESRTGTTLRLTLPCSKTVPSYQSMDFTLKSSFFDSNPKTHYSEEISTKTGTGGYSFLQALSNVRYGGGFTEPSEEESIYVHPQAKRSSLILSEKSLQLCTENLGNETGTDIAGNNSVDLLCSSSEQRGGSSAGDSPTREQTREARPVLGGKKTKRTQNFPPPLTTIRGSESLHVRPHREEGRLVIEAVRVTSSASCFKAERSHGRLRLRLLENESTRFDEEDEEKEKVDDESEMNEEEEEDEEEYERDGKREQLRGYDRPRRCREGESENNEMLMMEPLWVTSS